MLVATAQQWGRVAAMLFVALLMTHVAAAQTPAAALLSAPAEEDVRILEVVLDEAVLSEALVAYAGPSGGTLLPLQAMSELLAVAIASKPADGVASGFVFDERRTFHLDVTRRHITIAGKSRSFERSLVRLHHDDIYVDSALLGEWLPVAFDIDLFALRIRVRPREPLPLQQRLERERRIRHWRLQLPPADPGYPRLRTPYGLWETPFVDQTLRLSLGEASTASFSTYATGDLLFMESEAYLAGDNSDPFDTARLTLRRRDPAGAVGGWLRATEVAVGHVIHPSSGLLANSSEPLPGFLLSNLPLNRPAEFDRHSFRGNLPPGWDVELYHNGALLDYQQSRAGGQYVFDNVPVLFGMNFFRLVFYGPQGQRREEHHRFLLGESLTLPGRFEYRVVGNIENDTTRRASAFGSYGISSHVTAMAEAAMLPTPEGERQYGKVGLRTFWSALFAYGDVVQDDRGGRAWEGGLQTRIFGSNLLLSRQAASGGFVSEAFAFAGDPLLSRDRVRVDTAIPASILPRIPISLELDRQRFTSGVVRTTAQNRLSMHYKGLSMTNRALWQSITGQPSRVAAALQLSRYIRGVGVRGELLYGIAPLSFTTANVMVEKSLRAGYRVYGNVSRSFLGSAHVYSIGIDKTSGTFAAGVNAMRDPGGNAAANVDLSAGFGREPRERTWVPDARGRAGLGAVSARVFLDRNENGRFDEGDQPLPAVGFTINGVQAAPRTNEAGIVFMPELSPHQPADIAIDARTLEDPQWLPDVRGLRLVPRPGKAVPIEVPVVMTAEIEGTVYTARGGVAQGLAGATIELLNAAGEVVQKTTSAYDGFYVLTQVRRGPYRVRLAKAANDDQPKSVQVANALHEREKAVTVTAESSVVSGIDFALAPAATRTPPAVIAEQPLPLFVPPGVAPAADASVASGGEYVVQIGSFSVAANASRQANALRNVVNDVTIVKEGSYSVIRSGRRTRADAAALAETLSNRGIEALVLRAAGSPEPAPAVAARFVVQLGAFTRSENALDLTRRVRRSGAPTPAAVDRRGTLFFVQTEPFATLQAATAAREALRRLGFEGLVRESR
jgi:cell division septation protein DedD